MTAELAFYINPHIPGRQNLLRLLAETGIRQIGMEDCLWDPERDRTLIESFLRELSEFGLSVCSIHAFQRILAEPDKEQPPELFNEHLAALKRISVLGAKTSAYHVCHMRDVVPEKIDTMIEKAGWERYTELYAKALKSVAKEAARYGITIVLENIFDSKHAKSVKGFIEIIQMAGEANIGIVLDSGHTNLVGLSVAEEIRAAGILLRDTHFNDNIGPLDGPLPSADQHLPPGLGTINWQEVCMALKEINYTCPVVFEDILEAGDGIKDTRFGGKLGLSHKDLINITISNWRSFECLAGYYFNLKKE